MWQDSLCLSKQSIQCTCINFHTVSSNNNRNATDHSTWDSNWAHHIFVKHIFKAELTSKASNNASCINHINSHNWSGVSLVKTIAMLSTVIRQPLNRKSSTEEYNSFFIISYYLEVHLHFIFCQLLTEASWLIIVYPDLLEKSQNLLWLLSFPSWHPDWWIQGIVRLHLSSFPMNWF